MSDGPRRLADLTAGVRLREEATGRVWTIERVVRANSYSTPWVHLTSDAGDARIQGAGDLIDDPDAWTYS